MNNDGLHQSTFLVRVLLVWDTKVYARGNRKKLLAGEIEALN